jgi:hypothetical protein
MLAITLAQTAAYLADHVIPPVPVRHQQGRCLRVPPLLSFFTKGVTVKITMFNDRPVRHVQYMPDGSVILKLYERRPSGRARHLRVSLAQ